VTKVREYIIETGNEFKAIMFVIAVLSLGGTMLLYREALQLPFFFDDMIHLRWLDWHGLPSVWTTAEGLGYYRPLTMSVWKVDHLLFGGNDPNRLHLLSLLLHVLNSGLVGYLGWNAFQGQGRSVYAVLASLIFLSFPFSYQAVPSTSSLSKPLIAALALGAVLLYWEARRRRSRWLTVLSVLAAFLAPFAYETGVMIPLAILAVEGLGCARREFPRFSWLPILFMLLMWGVALPVIVLMEPETGASLRLPSLPDLWQNGVYFAQGLIFPLAPISTPLERILGIDRYVLLGLVDLLGFSALLFFYRWARQMKLFWYALSWFVVGILPLWLMLDFRYVITSPRILYLGAVGGVMLWAGIPVFLWTRLSGRRWSKVLAVAVVVGVLGFNVAYVRRRMALAEVIATPLWQAADAAKEEGASARLLYLNVPVWIAPKTPTYRVGTEGLTFIPDYVRVQDFVYVNAGVEPRIVDVTFDPAKREWAAYLGYMSEKVDWAGLAQEIRRADGVYLTTYSPDELRFVEAGALERTDALRNSDAVAARFGEQILLLDHEVETLSDELVLKLWWYCQQTSQEDMTVFAHVYDEAGQLIAQADGYPILGLFPARRWEVGDLVRDVRYITLPEDMAGTSYTVAVGWYHVGTGERLPAFDQRGEPVAREAIQVFP
jgi:hypothetical protein